MSEFPQTPAEWERLADYVVRQVDERLRSAFFEPVVDADELARLLKTSKATVERKTRAGLIPSVKVGDLRRYLVDDVFEALRETCGTSTTTAPC